MTTLFIQPQLFTNTILEKQRLFTSVDNNFALVYDFSCSYVSRMLVMKKSAGTPSSLYSGDGQRSGGQHLIQAVGPDFSRLSRDLNRVVLKIQHQTDQDPDCPMHAQRSEEYSGGQYSDRRRPMSSAELSESRRGSRGHLEVT